MFLCLILALVAASQQLESSSCTIESWNQKDTHSIPHNESHKKWMQQNYTRRDNMYGAKMRLLNAFVYEEFIAVTTTVEYKTGRTAYCRYFDCNRQEIPGSTWKSSFFPMTTVYCVRRAGAKYVSVSFEKTGDVPAAPVPLTFRAFQKPAHELSLCVGPFYGDDKKWLHLIEFVEHHRAIGVTMFYFTIFNMDRESRLILDEYERLGLAETTVIQTEYEKLDWQFHLIQIHDCFHRSKYHSKWVINADIDERFTMLQPDMTIFDLLNSLDSSVGEINFQARRLQKTEFSPDAFTDTSDAIRHLESLKFNQTAFHTWASSKSINRPEKVAALTYHYSRRQYPGVTVRHFPNSVGEFRHYRITQLNNSIGNGWTKRDKIVEETWLKEDLEEELVHRVVEMTKQIYESQ